MEMQKIYGRDIVGIIVVLMGMLLIALGIDHFVSGIVIMVVTYYFARRIDGEGNPKKDLNSRVKKVEETLNPKILPPEIKHAQIQKTKSSPEKLTTGDFKLKEFKSKGDNKDKQDQHF